MTDKGEVTLPEYVDVLGRCADFCQLDGPTVGATVEAHGAWCVSRPCSDPQTGRDLEARPWEMTTELASEYVHGRYRRDDLIDHPDTRLVRLSIEPAVVDAAAPMPFVFQISSGEARRLAATLQAAADQTDRIDLKLNAARPSRR